MPRIDLHTHTTESDGTLSPVELVLEAKKALLTGLAITDHDIESGYHLAKETADRCGIALLTGVELSATLDGAPVHILGYAFHPSNVVMKEKCAFHQIRRRERNREILRLLSKKGMQISESDLPATGTVGRPHIALCLLKHGFISTFKEAFHRYIGEGKSCYVPGERWSVEEALDIIHQAGGKAVLAHPHLINKNSLVKKLLRYPFDGIEGFYGNFDERTNNRWCALARERGWLVTGGSDFHGAIKPEAHLGMQSCPEGDFKILIEHFNEQLS